MKKILLGASLFLSMLGYSQNWGQPQKFTYCSISVGGDLRNCTIGSDPTNNQASPDVKIGIHAVGNNFELNPEVELFPKIGFSRYALNVGYHLDRYVPLEWINSNWRDKDVDIVPYFGASVINRDWTKVDAKKIWTYDPITKTSSGEIYETSSHWVLQAGMGFRFPLGEKFIIEPQVEAMTRQDKVYGYGDKLKVVTSVFLNLHYKLN